MKKGYKITAVVVVAALAALAFWRSWTVSHDQEKIKTVQIGVAVYNAKDAFISDICGYLEEEIYKFEEAHPQVRLNWEIADAGGSQKEQNSQIERFISLEYDLLLVNLVDRTNASVVIDKASKAEIPVVFFNREPVREDIFRCADIYYEGSDSRQSAILQAGIIADMWETNREFLDRNGDDVLEYAMLKGESGHQDTLIRSEWVIKELESRGVKTEKIVSSIGNFERSQANVIVRQWMEEYEQDIEIIISNNDDMAIGACEALEEKGNTDIKVVGIDGVEEVVQLIEEGKILGTVLCDTRLHAQALLEFIEALTIDPEAGKLLPLTDERYYMIPLSVITKS